MIDLVRPGLMLALVTGAWLSMPTQALAQRAYLDDSNRRAPPTDYSVDSADHGFPRVLVHELAGNVSAEAYSKYHFVDAKGNAFQKFGQVQGLSPDSRMLRHISGRAYQSYAYAYCVISGGLAFESTTSTSQGGPQSSGCGIYAGHWLYKAGTTLRQSVSSGATVIPVNDTSRISNGSYVVIYDAPAGSFRNAEHARVTGINGSNKTITVVRGYKSTAKARSSGAIVAEHVLGQGNDKRLWAFNLSTQSPRDASGKTFGEFYADWLGRNLARYDNGKLASVQVAGVLFDADFYFELTNYKTDVNNDLKVDNGISPGGVNWLGDGLDYFYQRVSNRLPGKYVLAGVHDGRGFNSAHGTQVENWLDYGNGDYKPNPKYDKLNDLFATYLFNMAERSQGPALVHNLTKTPTKLYPGKAGSQATNNRPFRLALALTLMDDGYFGLHSDVAPDAWWDEYAVDVQKGSSTYGKAISKSNVAQVRQNRGWLGNPLGSFRRIYTDTNFAPTKSLIGNGTFDSNTNGWIGDNVSLSRDASNAFDGAGALRVSPMINYRSDLGGASARSPAVSIVGGQSYTVALSMRSSSPREIRIALGDAIAKVPVGTKWRRYVLTLKPTRSSSTRMNVNVGREETQVWVDSAYIFRGDTNVFSREFQNGMVLANATNSSKTISVGSNFRRINGTQDRSVNYGDNVTSVTLAPYDGIVLVRREGAGGGTSEPTGPTGPTGGTSAGNGSIGDLVWRDSDGNGVQGSGEPGWSGVSVRLRQCNGAVLRSATTDASGRYSFGDLGQGKYQVEVLLPSGAKFSPQGRGTNTERNSDVTPSTGMTWCTSITSAGENRSTLDSGLVPTSGTTSGGSTSNTSGSSLGDYVWNDKNRDGVQNSGEPGLANVKVNLRDCNGVYKRYTKTNANGAYSFKSLPAGKYLVHFVTPNGMKISPHSVGKDGTDSDALGNGYSHCLTLGTNDGRVSIDAGFHW